MFYPPQDIRLKIDKNQKFVSIELHVANMVIIWKDSLRLFPLSLADLTKTMGLIGKTEPYNKEDFGSLDLFDNPTLLQRFKDYSLQRCFVPLQCFINSTGPLSIGIPSRY